MEIICILHKNLADDNKVRYIFDKFHDTPKILTTYIVTYFEILLGNFRNHDLSTWIEFFRFNLF